MEPHTVNKNVEPESQPERVEPVSHENGIPSHEPVTESEDGPEVKEIEDFIATIAIEAEHVTESEDDPEVEEIEDSIATIAIDSDDESDALEPPFECLECYLVLVEPGWPHDCPLAFNDHLDC